MSNIGRHQSKILEITSSTVLTRSMSTERASRFAVSPRHQERIRSRSTPNREQLKNNQMSNTERLIGGSDPTTSNSQRFKPVFDVLRKFYRSNSDLDELKSRIDNMTQPDILSAVHKIIDSDKRATTKIREIRKRVEEAFASCGLCCGQRMKVVQTRMLRCSKDSSCPEIFPGSMYYSLETKEKNAYFTLCPKHFEKLTEDFLLRTYNVQKSAFKQLKYDPVEEKKLEQCKICKTFLHEPCRRLLRYRGENNCVCQRAGDEVLDNCLMDDLKETSLSKHIQKAVSTELKKYKGILVREIFSKRSSYFATTHGARMKEKFARANINLEDYATHNRFVAVSQKQNDVDTIFMLFTTTEYPDTRWCSLTYLDTVPLVDPITPDKLRRWLYLTVLGSYTVFMASIGYKNLYFYAAPPAQTDTFLFHFKGEKGARAHTKRKKDLITFYEYMLNYGHEKKAIVTWYNEPKLSLKKPSVPQMVTELAYSFHFPSIIDDTLDKHLKKPKGFNYQLFLDDVCEQMKLAAEDTGDEFYVELNTSLDELKRESEEEVFSSFITNKEEWIKMQIQQKWEFASRQQAQYASLRIIRLLKTNSRNEKYMNELGAWSHPTGFQDVHSFAVNEDCFVKHLGQKCNGRVIKVGARKGNARGYSVKFKWAFLHFIKFVPFNEADETMFKASNDIIARGNDLERASAQNKPPQTSSIQPSSQSAPQKRLTSGQDLKVPSGPNQLPSALVSTTSTPLPMPTRNEQVFESEKNNRKRKQANNSGPNTRLRGRHEIPEERETQSSSTNSRENLSENSPTPKKKSRRP